MSPQQTVTHYEVLGKLGQGAMGSVFKARDTKLKRYVALKFLSPDLMKSTTARNRFFEEGKALASLSHPNIATVFEVDESEGVPFLALEYLRGGTLRERIRAVTASGSLLSVRDVLDWGAAMADPSRETIVMVGDGTYMMMNSDIYSTVLSGHKMIVVLCDNGGYAVINRLQNFKGGASFNNLIKDCRVKEPFGVDFVKHAESMGALARKVESLADLGAALDWAKTTDRTTVITIVCDAFVWTPGDALWDVGVPTVSARPEVLEAAKYQADVRSKQRVGV